MATTPNTTCLWCSARYYAPPGQLARRRFCSRACRKLASEDCAAALRPRRRPREATRPKPEAWSLPATLALVEMQMETATGPDAMLLAILHDSLTFLRTHPTAPMAAAADREVAS